MKKLLSAFFLFFILSSFIFSQFRDLPNGDKFENISGEKEARIIFNTFSVNEDGIVILAVIPKDFYAYIDSPYAKKITFTKNGKAINTVYPEGIKKGEDTIIKGQAYFTLMYDKSLGTNIDVEYQLCVEKDNICLPPMTETVAIKQKGEIFSSESVSNIIENTNAAFGDDAVINTAGGNESPPENATAIDGGVKQNMASKIAGEKNIFLVILIIFAAGFLSSFLPCMYPLIPVTASILSGRTLTEVPNTKPNMKNIILSSLLFCFGIIITYTLLGSIVSLASYFFGSVLQFGSFGYNPFVLSLLVLLFLFFTFSMAGFYEISVFGFLQNVKSSAVSKTSLWHKFVAGCLTALVASPCAAPVVATILELAVIYPSRGAIYMASYASGFSLFLFGIGVSSAFITALPKPGAWMNAVRLIFTAVMVGVCLYYAGILFEVLRAGRYSTFIASVIILLFGTLVFVIKRKNIGIDKKSVAAVFMIILLFNIFAFIYDSMKPYEEKGITYEEAITLSQENGKGLFIDFSAVWCENCRLLKKNVLSNKELKDYIDKNFVFVEVDIDKRKDIAEKYGVRWLPWIVVTDESGKEVYKINKFSSFDYDMTLSVLSDLEKL